MWDGPGPRQGPRGGPPFRGDHRGEMFYGRDRPMQDFRGRDGMNMGPMGNMGPRHLDLPPMDMRRMDGPPVRGRDMDPRDMDPRDMDPRDMRGREPNRDFFRPGEEPDFSHRRHHDFPIRDRGFPGPGRNLADMGGRGMPPRDLNDRYMDTRERDRDSFHYDAPHYGDANIDGRRMFPPERDGGFRDMRDGPAMDMRDRPPMDIRDSERFDMDLPPRERRLLETDRRGGPPHNQRGGFDSDMDFRNRHGSSAEFRGRDRSPLRYGNDDAPPGDRGRSDMPPDVAGHKRSEFMGSDGKLEEREYPDQSDSPLMDYRCGEEMTLAEEWKNRKKDKNPFLTTGKGLGGLPEPSFPVGFGRDLTARDQLPYQERDRPPVDFQGKDAGFPHGGRFPPVDLPPIGSRPPHDRPLLESSPFPGRENQNKRWLGESDQKHSQSQLIYDERPPYHKEKNMPLLDIQVPTDGFKGLKDVPLGQDPSREKVRAECDIQSSTCQPRDQDYRDIDYRTGSTRTFEYNHEELQATGKPPKESDHVTPSEVSESGSQDQDYRSASLEGKVSNTISVTGIPKTATMEQILGAFAGRDGAPMPGIKIKNVVPGYSYDTAYVEFLNLEDAVHFMESNKVANPRHSTKAVTPIRTKRGCEGI